MDTLYSQIGAVVWLAVCAFALAKGDQPERTGAGAMILAWLATLAVHRESAIYTVPIPVLVIDVLLLAVMLGLSWRTDRSWPVWGAAFQAIIVLVHIVTMFDPRIRAIAYLSAQTVGSYGLLTCLAVGTFWAWQTRKAIGMSSEDDDDR